MPVTDYLLPIGIGLLFAAVHYWSSIIHARATQIRSGVAGLSIAYLFLQFYPQAILAGEAAGHDLATVFIWICGGIAIMVLLENIGGKIFPVIRFSAFQLAIGLLMIMLLSFNRLQGWLFLAWAVLLSSLSAISLGAISVPPSMRIVLAATTLIGILAAAFLPIPVSTLLLLQAALVGAATVVSLNMLAQFRGIPFVVGIILGSVAILLL